MYDADKTPVVVISNKELLFLVAVFIFILIQLYPKNVLQKIIEDDHSDYALTMVYLQDLLKHDPNDAMLNLVYLKKRMEVRDINTSIPLANRLMQSKKEIIRNQATLLAFNAYMIQYFQTKNAHAKHKIYNKIRKLFYTIYVKKLYDDDAKQWYSNATFVQNDPARYFFLQQLLNKEPTNVAYLRDAYFLALKLGHKKDASRYMDALLVYDTKNPQQWAIAKYNALLSYKKYDEAQLVLEKNANRSLKIKKLLASFYLMRSMYVSASKTYLELSKDVTDKQKRDFYVKKAIQALQSGNLLNEAANLAHNYENEYLGDSKMRQFILKIYLAAGKLDLADAYSKRILQHGGLL
ncbi:hypothetical protein MNB_SM-6-692 [hydrothermal vent metagenome]|uniref:Extracellular Matrix protein PelB n=1 Tax=hydrothermal vent metagenome TaxID=652676 RepID=A0A1W1BXZ2_9ZZZZ